MLTIYLRNKASDYGAGFSPIEGEGNLYLRNNAFKISWITTLQSNRPYTTYPASPE